MYGLNDDIAYFVRQHDALWLGRLLLTQCVYNCVEVFVQHWAMCFKKLETEVEVLVISNTKFYTVIKRNTVTSENWIMLLPSSSE